MPLRRVRIVSNGTNRGTKITDAMTGEELPDIYGLKIEMNGGPSELAKVELTACAEFEIETEADVKIVRRNIKTQKMAEIHPITPEDIEAAYLRFTEYASESYSHSAHRQAFEQAVYGLLEQYGVLTAK